MLKIFVVISLILFYVMQTQDCFFKGTPKPEGAKGCGNDRQIATCSHGEFIMQDCGPGTKCKPLREGFAICG
jgi:hypothetical protein